MLFSGEDGSGILKVEKPLGGYVAEVAAAFNAFRRWTGEVSATAFLFENSEYPDSPVYVCGRYFNTSDPRFPLHPLSLRLINAKRYPGRQANLFRRVLELWYSTMKLHDAIIVAIPQRPGAEPNVATMAVEALNVKGATRDVDLLACPVDYPKQKEAGSYEARRENVRGVFQARRRLDGETVIVLDDITTSFSTLNEARSVLFDAGAGRVIPVALAFHPPELWGGPSVEYPKCGQCGHEMVVRYRTADGEPFFACGDYEAYRRRESHPVVSFDTAYRQLCAL